jgi:hypothetical protein
MWVCQERWLAAALGEGADQQLISVLGLTNYHQKEQSLQVSLAITKDG